VVFKGTSPYFSHLRSYIYIDCHRVAAEWITAAAKDREKPPRRGTGAAETKQANSRVASSDGSSEDEGNGAYDPEVDDTPCMLYIHGGKYFRQPCDKKG
jgi:hypothetical protein